MVTDGNRLPGFDDPELVMDGTRRPGGLIEPGKAIAPFRRTWAQSRLGRRLAFGWWGVGDADALAPELAEAFLVGPAHHTKTRQAGRALLATNSTGQPDRLAC